MDAIHQGFSARVSAAAAASAPAASPAPKRLADDWRLTLTTDRSSRNHGGQRPVPGRCLGASLWRRAHWHRAWRRSAFTFDAGAGHDSNAWPALVAIDELVHQARPIGSC